MSNKSVENYLLLQTETIYTMNTSAVLCILVVVAYIHTVNSETNYTVGDLKKHLKVSF